MSDGLVHLELAPTEAMDLSELFDLDRDAA